VLELWKFAQKRHAPPGGTRPAARRQRRDSASTWQQGATLVLGGWCTIKIYLDRVLYNFRSEGDMRRCGHVGNLV